RRAARSRTLRPASTVESAANARAKDEGAGTVGIGAGAAIHIVDDVNTAVIAAGAAIAGAKDVALTATGVNTLTSYAEAGTAGAAGSTLSLPADAAITL